MKKTHLKYFKASLAAAATGLTASTGQAYVVSTLHGNTLDFNAAGGSDTPVPFDITDDEVNDYQFAFANNNIQKPQLTTVNFNGSGTNQICLPTSDQDHRTLPVLSLGQVVDQNLFGGVTLNQAFFFQNYEGNYYGDWAGPGGAAAPSTLQGPVEGYVGLAVDAGGGNHNYGYAHFSVDLHDKASQIGSVTVLDSAYETVVNQPITIDLPPDTLNLQVNTVTGEVLIQNPHPTAAVAIDYYQITSARSPGALSTSGWNSLDDQVVGVGPAAPDGDYNGDGTVNAADYTAWRDTLGSTTDFRADGNEDGKVDDLDFGMWKANFGSTSSGVGIGWNEAGGANATFLAESFLDADGSTLAGGTSLDLGSAFNPAVFGAGVDGDLVFEYSRGDKLITGTISYVNGGGATLATSAVPEPASFVLLLGAGLTAGTLRWRLKSA